MPNPIVNRRVVEASASFSPIQVPGLFLWFRADLLSLANGAGIATWADQSGNHLDLTQSTGANQPAFIRSGQGGQPVVRLSVSTHTRMNSPSFSKAAPVTVFLAASMTNDVGSRLAFLHDGGSNSNCTYECQSSITYVEDLGGSNFASFSETFPFSFRVMTTRYLPARIQTYVNGVSKASSAASSFTLTAFTLGDNYNGGVNSGGSHNWNGDVGEILVYAADVSVVNRTQVEDYLKKKYNL